MPFRSEDYFNSLHDCISMYSALVFIIHINDFLWWMMSVLFKEKLTNKDDDGGDDDSKRISFMFISRSIVCVHVCVRMRPLHPNMAILCSIIKKNIY